MHLSITSDYLWPHRDPDLQASETCQSTTPTSFGLCFWLRRLWVRRNRYWRLRHEAVDSVTFDTSRPVRMSLVFIMSVLCVRVLSAYITSFYRYVLAS
jgi:hypothetical protein